MIIGSISENLNIEKRISITPDIIKKYLSMGFKVNLPKNYGSHLGISDGTYNDLGVEIINDENEIIKNSNLIVQLNLPADEKISHMKNNQILIGSFNSHSNKNEIQKILEIFCQKVTDVGDFGNGTIMKLIGNILNLVHNAVSAEVIGLGIKSGLDPKIIHDAISGTFSSSGVFENRGKLMVEEDYNREGMNFSTPIKDSAFITDLSKKFMMPLPIYQVALQYYYAAIAQGHFNKDAASVLKAIENNANIKRN